MDKKLYIKINVSEISSCISKNQYLSQDIMVLKLWKKQDPISFNEALSRNKLYISDVKNKKYTEKIKYMENGKQNEIIVIDDFQKKCNVSVKNNNEKRYSMFISKPSKGIMIYNLIIAGFIDGIVEKNEEKYIIEIKNRQNKLLRYIPENEKVQLIVYMKLTNIYKCKHIEKYNKEMNIIDFDYDEKTWNTIKEDLLDFINYFEKVYFNNVFQDIFLNEKIMNNKKNLKFLESNFNYTIKKNKDV